MGRQVQGRGGGRRGPERGGAAGTGGLGGRARKGGTQGRGGERGGAKMGGGGRAGGGGEGRAKVGEWGTGTGRGGQGQGGVQGQRVVERMKHAAHSRWWGHDPRFLFIPTALDAACLCS